MYELNTHLLKNVYDRSSSYVGIGFVLNISGSERRLLFTVYHPLSIVDFLFPLTLPKYQDHTILIKV